MWVMDGGFRFLDLVRSSATHTGAIMVSSSSIPVATDNDIQVLQHVLISRYITAAAVVILVYDTLLTLNEEVGKRK